MHFQQRGVSADELSLERLLAILISVTCQVPLITREPYPRP